MKQIIKDLLIELTVYGNRKFDGVLIEKAFSEMGSRELSTLIEDLLGWQKSAELKWDSKLYFEDHFAFEEGLQIRFDDFFKYTPELKEVFKLETGKITYNENLDKEEISEIRKYVDANYTPFFHRYTRKN